MSDVHQLSQLNWAIGCIDNELSILTRLLYRNNNQHGKSLVFSNLKGLCKHLKLLNSEVCRQVVSNLDTSVRLANQHKQSQVQFDEILKAGESVFLGVCISLVGVNHGMKASESLIKLLSNKVFVPLFSLLLALTSRIVKCLSILAINFQSRLFALCDQIKHIGVIHEKYASEVKSFLRSVTLSAECIHTLNLVKSALEAQSSGVPSSSSFKKKNLSFGEMSQKSDSDLFSTAAVNAAGEDTGDIIGTVGERVDPVSRDVHSDSEIEDNCGMMIDSEDEKEPTRNLAKAVPLVGKTLTDPITDKRKRPSEKMNEATAKKTPTSSGGGGLAIDPVSFFSDTPAPTKTKTESEPVGGSTSGTSATGAADKTNFKKKKTLKALQRKAERANREKSGKDKDDIDDIFGGLV